MTQIKIFSDTFDEVENKINKWLTSNYNNNTKINIKSITQSHGEYDNLCLTISILYEKL